MGKGVYTGFLVFMLVLNGAILATPLLAFAQEPPASASLPSGLAPPAPYSTAQSHPSLASTLYQDVFIYFCHQKISRSLCLFQGPDGYFVADCIPQYGTYIPDDSAQVSTVREGAVGYKFPVCARDVAIYLAMLLAGVAYPFRYRLNEKEMPDPLYLIVALIPIGLDGGLQLISNMGIALPLIGMYESTNFLRIVTGLIAGAVVPFYLLPMLNRVVEKKEAGPKPETTESLKIEKERK